MKTILLIAAAGAGALAVYLVSQNKKSDKGGCGCGKSSAKIVKQQSPYKQSYPDQALQEFDTRFKSIFPSAKEAIGSPIHADDTDMKTAQAL